MGRMTRPTRPTPSKVNPEAQSTSDLSPAEHARYKDIVYLFEEGRSFKRLVTKAIARLQAQIKSCVSPEWQGILADRITPYEQLVRLKQQFAPRKNTRVQDFFNDWRWWIYITDWQNLLRPMAVELVKSLTKRLRRPRCLTCVIPMMNILLIRWQSEIYFTQSSCKMPTLQTWWYHRHLRKEARRGM